jgi:L-seryl-tRNA(Ser) seleniumtransferase
MPEIMRLSGARMVEVGTTNRTRLEDYAAAISPKTAAIMKVHASNFRVVGFSETVDLKPLADLAHQRGIWLLHDLGSGSLLNSGGFGLGDEPTLQDSLEAGAHLVAASGDKLFGGPPAGLLLGRETLLARVLKHPLARAVRVDKLTLAALGATLDLYLTQSLDGIPVWGMLGASKEAMAHRAESWKQRLGALGLGAELADGESAVGGGSLPGQTLPTTVLVLTPGRIGAAELLRRLRDHEPPLVGRIDQEKVLLDPRTVLPDEDDALIDAVASAYQ